MGRPASDKALRKYLAQHAEPEAAQASEAEGSDEQSAADDPVEVEEPPTSEEVVGDVDWESYMESRPQTSLSHGDDDRPPIEDNLSPETSLSDHLYWQLGFADLTEIECALGALIIGNLDENPLDDILADYDPWEHSIVGPLLRGGPAALITEYEQKVEHEEGYADACHLCFSMRKQMRELFPIELGPPSVYGVIEPNAVGGGAAAPKTVDQNPDDA